MTMKLIKNKSSRDKRYITSIVIVYIRIMNTPGG